MGDFDPGRTASTLAPPTQASSVDGPAAALQNCVCLLIDAHTKLHSVPVAPSTEIPFAADFMQAALKYRS